jgi:hypothetical protein
VYEEGKIVVVKDQKGEIVAQKCPHCSTTFSKRTATSTLQRHIEISCPVLNKNKKKRSGEPFEKTKADMLLCKVVVNNYLALSIMESEDLKEFFRYIAPHYQLPTRKTLAKELLPTQQTLVKKSIEKRIRKIPYLSLTTDGWTSAALSGYLGVTAHGVTEDWKMESFFLGLIPVRRSETAEFIADSLEQLFEDWQLTKDRIAGICTDGGSNMVSAATKQLELTWIYCGAHIINLAIHYGLKNSAATKELIRKTKCIVRVFKRSPRAAQILREQQRLERTGQLPLIQETKTRWGSAYEMLSRLLQCKSAVSSALTRVSMLRLRSQVPALTQKEWDHIQEIVPILQLLDASYRTLALQEQPTIGLWCAVLRVAIDKHLAVIDSDSPFLQAFKKSNQR